MPKFDYNYIPLSLDKKLITNGNNVGTLSGYFNVTISIPENRHVIHFRQGTTLFKIRNKYAFAGSSVRGNIRALVELFSHSCLEYSRDDKPDLMYMRLKKTNSRNYIKKPELGYIETTLVKNGKLIVTDEQLSLKDKNGILISDSVSYISDIKVKAIMKKEADFKKNETEYNNPKRFFYIKKGLKYYISHQNDIKVPLVYKRSNKYDVNEIDFGTSIFGQIKTDKTEQSAKVIPSKVDFDDFVNTNIKARCKYTPIEHDYYSPRLTDFRNFSSETEVLDNWDEPTPLIKVRQYWNNKPEIIVGENRILSFREKFEFKGKIRFNGLTKEELGLLCLALDLPDAHKIGYAKASGYGAIKLTTKLVLINRKKRYETSFYDLRFGWNLGESEEENEIYKSAYNKYYKDNLGEDFKENETVKSVLKGLQLQDNV